MKLEREFYERDGLTVAKELLGKVLVHESEGGLVSGRIVESEAYLGPEDKAAHTWKGRRTSRTEVIFGRGGYAYVYLVYGMHCCLNVTANVAGKPECVLLRALEPVEGIELLCERRRTAKRTQLCNGPGKLCCAMGITRELYGEDLCGERLYIVDDGLRDFAVEATTRIGIDYAEEYRTKLWRFCVSGSEYLSKKLPPAFSRTAFPQW